MENNTTQNQFEAIFKFANECIIVVDNQGVIRQLNPSGLALFGYSEQEIINEKIEVLIPQRFKENHVGHRDGFTKNPHARPMGKGIELFGLKKNGGEFPLEVSLSTFISKNETFNIAFIIDISERKELESKDKNYRKVLEQEVENRTLVLKEAINKLEKTKEELDESLRREIELNAIKTRFVSIASHEFRTPLSTMLSSLNLIEKYNELNIADKRDKHIARIKNSIKLLTDILNDILSVNMLEDGKVILNPSDFNISEFVSETISEIKDTINNGQFISLNNNNLDTLSVFQDSKILRHILLNLLSNAIKFSYENTEIQVTIKANLSSFFITVKDKGIGIPEQNQKHLFDRFFRAENVEQIQGTGLGLSIVSQYTQLMGGNVSYKSTENIGSKFSIELPMKYKNKASGLSNA